jgi:hypothetical protein
MLLCWLRITKQCAQTALHWASTTQTRLEVISRNMVHKIALAEWIVVDSLALREIYFESSSPSATYFRKQGVIRATIHGEQNTSGQWR